ncbi:hypothetical protein CC78DRAFT_459932 [Lojkania enalia]|uniref:Dynamin family protein n=1 Tax=Lojkania enalia TaxID=147567 RepID=A0A9P4KCG1_9PLEO|nr:hypothetical protein CC78DRAFT_459932 [Didymosphaeria enalia]
MTEPSKILEGTTLHQLLSEDEAQLLDTIDELRSQGIGRLLGEAGLPQLIVCGDQSSGKSSVLEALTRVYFPTRSSVCTTFPTELRLRREPRSHISCRIKAASTRSDEEKIRLAGFRASFDSPEKFPDLITAARDCMSTTDNKHNNDTFFNDILEVEIIGPKLAPLTVVDLPGLTHYGSQTDIEKVSTLVKSYMAKSNSLILAIVSAHNDINNQIVLSHIKDLVPDGHRTLGIITKPDTLPSGSEREQAYLEHAQNNPDKFQYGWHVIRNRAYEEQASSFDERDAKERDFFTKSNWAPLEGREVGLGIDTLRQKLSRMLLDHISLSLPGIMHKLERDLSHDQNELIKLGETRSNLKEQQNYLSEISDGFSMYTKDALDGRYHSTAFFGDPLGSEGRDRRLRAVVRNLNDVFANDMLQYGHKWHLVNDSNLTSEIFSESGPLNHSQVITKSDFIKKHVDTLARNERSTELPGISNPSLVGSLFRQQSEPWESIASAHLLKVWKAVKNFLEVLLNHLTDERTCNQLLIHVIDPALEERRGFMRQKLKELLVPHREYDPITVSPHFARTIWNLREKSVKRSVVENIRKEFKSRDSKDELPSTDEIIAKIGATSAPLDDQYGSNETLEFMQAYYETTLLGFINNVASLAVEQCLLSGLWKIFSSAAIRDMSDETLSLIASESRDVQMERSRLRDRVEVLQKGLRTIKRIQPSKTSSISPAKLQTCL